MRTPDSWQTARATVAIAVVIFIVDVILNVFRIHGQAIALGAFIPVDLAVDFPFARVPFFLTPLTATLLHSSIWHLAFNLLIHLFCGRAVEGAVGPAGLVILYVAGAFGAALGQFAMDPNSPVPMIGASGAISAIIGAYAMLFGRNRVKVADHRLALWLNVLWLLVAWVLLQVAMGLVFSQGPLLGRGSGMLLAVGAHIGGFVVGVALARPLLLYRYRNA